MSGGGPPAPAHNGIDVLCDAAASRGHYHQNPPPLRPTVLPQLRSPGPPRQSPLLSALPNEQDPLSAFSDRPNAKRKLEQVSPGNSVRLPSASSGSSHVCHICNRVYERADHLTRHLRSHENARPYMCTRCPKRFNRADLLTRHESTHDRSTGTADLGDDPAGGDFMPRSDRAGKACLACAAAKSKCEDRKPCSRCRARGVPCEPAPAKGSLSRQSSIAGMRKDRSPSKDAKEFRAPEAIPYQNQAPHAITNITPSNHTASRTSYDRQPGSPTGRDVTEVVDKAPDQFSMPEAFNDGTMFFGSAGHQFQDFGSWDLNFDDISLANLPGLEEVPGSYASRPPSSATGSASSSRAVFHDHSKGFAAFKRSPWLWEPEGKDYLARAKEGLALPTDLPSPSSSATTSFSPVPNRLVVTPVIRDNIFALVLSQHSGQQHVPSFPSLELLNHLVQVHFVQDLRRIDAMIHRPSFDTTSTITEMVAVIIASGASCISVPEIWKFGLALQEVIRIGLGSRFDGDNTATRDLTPVQAYLLMLDIGQWSGFSRKMEIAECFLQPIVTMLKVSGDLIHPPETESLWPSRSDPDDVLEDKWRAFIKRESYKRLTLHMFAHDAESSIGHCKSPLMRLSEFRFDLPASRALWRAGSAQEWRDIYLQKSTHRAVPRVADLPRHARSLHSLADQVDSNLCNLALLYGYWGQIACLAEALKFHRSSEPQPWMQAQHDAIYHSLLAHRSTLRGPESHPRLAFLAELLLMTINVPFDDLERFAGKFGEEEARLASEYMNANWARTVSSRQAAWHAGQVLSHARHLPPTSLRGFDAIAVYLAGLTLWIYGLLDNNPVDSQQHVVLDGPHIPVIDSFLNLGQGSSYLSNGTTGSSYPLSDTDSTLEIVGDILRDNFPVRTEPLPPLVDSLRQLLMDLGPGKGVSRRSSGL